MNNYFDKNILEANQRVLTKTNPELNIYLSNLDWKNKKNQYTFLESKNGEIIPVYSQSEGNSKPLHSTVDPIREAQRLISTITNNMENDTGFIVFLGLGGGFLPQEALDHTHAQVLVIDFCFDGIADLFSAKDYSCLFNNERFALLADPSNDDIKNFILEHYKPSLHGGIKTIPLRTRTEFDLSLFNSAADTIQEAIEIVSSDYSVQAHFGKRWFSNIIRNLTLVNTAQQNSIMEKIISHADEAAIVAAGPSLNKQLDVLNEYKSRKVFIISSDTALPVLLYRGIEPDAVVSIDCQHISYYHFIGLKLRNIPLILDIASPPLLSSLTTSACFFSSGHPLALYISQNWKEINRLDTSGGNVTYACLSFAEFIGAKRITLFGADFSYVNSESYARGTYIFPYFEKKQNRFSPSEALFSSFLYRSPFIPAENGENKKYHETSSLRFYRNKLEEKAKKMTTQITAVKGQGAPIDLSCNTAESRFVSSKSVPSQKKEKMNGTDFLEQYRTSIAALPSVKDTENYLQSLNTENRQIFTTLLPYAAALNYRNPLLKTKDLIEETKLRCVNEIGRVLNV